MHSNSLIVGLLLALSGVVRSQVNFGLALQRVFLSAAAYCDSESIKAWNCPACQQVAGFDALAYCYDAKYNGSAYVGKFNNQANTFVISFRGTDNLANWIQNLKFAKTSPFSKCPGCEVHLGFWEIYQGLQSQIKAAMKTLIQSPLLRYSEPTIIVTGHSLGAALATLCAYDLHSDGYTIQDLITFGSPRVGNQVFAQQVDGITSTSWRFVHYNDIVPHVPPEISGFWHIETEVWMTKDQSGYTWCSTGDGEDPNCSDSLSGITILEGLPAHLNYLNVTISDDCSGDIFRPYTDETELMYETSLMEQGVPELDTLEEKSED